MSADDLRPLPRTLDELLGELEDAAAGRITLAREAALQVVAALLLTD